MVPSMQGLALFQTIHNYTQRNSLPLHVYLDLGIAVTFCVMRDKKRGIGIQTAAPVCLVSHGEINH